MKVFVTGVGGQLGHDVINELVSRGYEGIGSDIAPRYSGVEDGSAVCTAPYSPMDITDAQAVEAVIGQAAPDVVIHCAAWTAVDLAEDEDKQEKVRAINAAGTRNITACIGNRVCPYACYDTTAFAKRIEKAVFPNDLHFKIALTGCPNDCGKVRLHDFGIMGMTEPQLDPKGIKY